MNSDNAQTAQGKGLAAADGHAGAGLEGGPPARVRPRFSLAAPLAVLLAAVGGALQGYTAGTLDAFFLALLLLVGGAAATALLFRGDLPELRVFLLSFGVCALAGGLAQAYSLSVFGIPMSTTDANNFFGAILPAPPFYSWLDLQTVWIGNSFLGRGAPLAVQTWQYLYHYFGELGFDHGHYLGTLFNALLVALTGAITVRTARVLFGADAWRLHRVGTLYALCGIFALFGGIFLRDSFTLFLNALVLWGLVRWLEHPTGRRYVLALVLTALSCACVWYLRRNSVYLFGLFHLLAWFCWYWRGEKRIGRLAATLFLPVLVTVASAVLLQYFAASIGVLTEESEDYVSLAAADSLDDSLGMALVVTQPLPVRAVLGSGVLLAFPIPLWSYLGPGATEYELIKTWQGVYKLFVLPLVFAGLVYVLREVRRRESHASGRLFIALYSISMVVAVAATSLETRHLGQFFPALLLLAVIPDTRVRDDRRMVRSMAALWVGVLVLVHLAWAGMRYL